MSDYIFNTSATPHIEVDSIGGDLTIVVADENNVKVQADDSGAKVEREGETLRARSSGDCHIECPANSTLTIKHVSGSLSVSEVGATLAIDTVGGEISLRDIGVVSIKHVSGDVSAHDIAGQLNIETAGSDIELRHIEGDLTIKHVSGDVSARGLGGSVNIGKAGGDVSLDADDLGDHKTYQVKASGDVTIRLAEDADASFKVKASGEIKRRVEFDEWKGNSREAQGSLGGGSAQVELQSGGDVLILPTREGVDFDFDALGSQFASKMGDFERALEEKMAELNSHIERMTALGINELETRLRRLDSGIDTVRKQGGRQADRIQRQVQRAQRQAERARERAQRQAERARRQAERAKERARHQAERRGERRVSVNVGSGATGRPAASQTTEAERKMILQMLSEHKITADEAAHLLEALEG